MKTKLVFTKFLSVILMGIGMFLFSCSVDEIPEVNDSQVALKSAPAMLTGTCPLIAGQHMNAGMVSYDIVDDVINVHIETNADWVINEVHIYAGDKDDLPMNKKAIKLGQFPVSEDNVGGETSIDRSLTVEDWGDTPILAVQVVVMDEMENTETAWAKCCSPVFAVKTRMVDASGTVIWGLSKGSILSTSGWCSQLGYNAPFPGTYDLMKLGINSMKVGEIVLHEDGTLEVIPGEGIKLCDSHAYIGHIEDLPSYGCPDYKNWYYTTEGDCTFDRHTHELTMPEEGNCSASFEDAYDGININKWGWITYL